jgi:putative drug exporter of the RND superfamily
MPPSDPMTPGAPLRVAAAHPRLVLGAWLVVVLVAILLVLRLSPVAFTTDVERSDGSDSMRVEALLAEHFPDRAGLGAAGEVLVLRSRTLTVDDPAFAEQAMALGQRLSERAPDILAGGTSYFLTGDESLVSTDRRATVMPLLVRDPMAQVERLRQIVREAAAEGPLEVLLIGSASLALDYKQLAEEDLRTELRVGLPVALLVLLGVFGSPVAALVPALVAFASIAVALAVTVLAGMVAPVYFLSTNMIVMMGLAVGIDYSLFVMSRYREERQAGRPEALALALAGDTAGRAIVHAGATVIVALVGLLLVPTNVFRGLAGGAIVVVAVSIVASFTLLPALIRLLGARVESRRAPRPEPGVAPRVGRVRFALRWPLTSLVVSSLLLLALAFPALQMRIGFSSVDTLPEHLETRQAFDLLQGSFRLGSISDAYVVIDGDPRAPGLDAAVQRLREALRVDPAFVADGLRDRLDASGGLRVLAIPMPGDAESAAAHLGIERLRREHLPKAFEGVPVTPRVGGPAARLVDFFALTRAWTPWVIGTVLALSFVLLTVAFRSVVVPLKAIVLNLLSVAAAYGAMVLVFQQGFGASLLGLQQVPSIEAWIPLFLFTVLYGLSMDYHVMLLSRMREHYAATRDTAAAVSYGLSTTARVITGAAAIMVAIFAGFAAGELVMFQQVGFGLAVAVLLDATLVRLVLLPASMTLLGARNWWLPAWLERLLPR